ncbi:hypothetical protein EK21DRAFT_87334 [Setomelanomma holmii]|uniref:BTB domain-containing protein n=1 Tax=Setomelanomma holmii TaxID=210430 RepID=A0A9P4HEQ7_9PLEO|nr:hypothetical protein EK21DRAFT_87334 [Setomelanomma holmii]
MLHSRLFAFLIGPEKAPMTVHADIIGSLSLRLSSLIYRTVAESGSDFVHFPQLKVCDFDRICELANRGDYTSPTSCANNDSKVNIKVDYFLLSESVAERYVNSKPTSLVRSFGAKSLVPNPRLRLPMKSDRTTTTKMPTTGLWTAVTTSARTERRISHLCCWVTRRLQCLALRKLHKYLVDIRVFALTQGPVIELLRFAYNTDNIPNDSMKPLNPQRKMIVEFVTVHIRAFGKFEGHRDVLRDCGKYAVDHACLLYTKLDNTHKELNEQTRKLEFGPSTSN